MAGGSDESVPFPHAQLQVSRFKSTPTTAFSSSFTCKLTPKPFLSCRMRACLVTLLLLVAMDFVCMEKRYRKTYRTRYRHTVPPAIIKTVCENCDREREKCRSRPYCEKFPRLCSAGCQTDYRRCMYPIRKFCAIFSN